MVLKLVLFQFFLDLKRREGECQAVKGGREGGRKGSEDEERICSLVTEGAL